MTEAVVFVTLDNPGERLDKALANALPQFSREQCQRLIRQGLVTIGGQPVKVSQRISGGENVAVRIPEAQPVDLLPESIHLDIRYEDEDLILVNKPAGMVVHPAPGHSSGTLVNAILAHCPDLEGIRGEQRPGIVHRLDKDTSGLILVAKNDRALQHLQKQFKQRTVTKRYHALVVGHFPQRKVLVDAPIGRDPHHRQRMTVLSTDSSARSRPAQTQIQLIRIIKDYSFLECLPLTGRTHQIRVHLAYINYPIVGDSIYGRSSSNLPISRHFLHAAGLTFRRPADEQEMSFTTELPGDLQAVLLFLEDKNYISP